MRSLDYDITLSIWRYTQENKTRKQLVYTITESNGSVETLFLNILRNICETLHDMQILRLNADYMCR